MPTSDSKNRIVGRVVAKDTRAGLADLVVVLYDLDPGEAQRGLQALDDVAAYSGSAAGFWAQYFPGDRLGSVLTDRDGRFVLEYADVEFQIGNTEKRPDLTLIILAPDEAIGKTFFGLHPLQRFLHLTLVPRLNAGRIESYVIAINSGLLDRHGLRGGALASSDKESYRTLIDQRYQAQAAMRAATKEHIADRRLTAMERTLPTRRAAWRWMASPNLFMPGIKFVEPGADPAATVEAARNEGIDALARYQPATKIRMHLTPLDLAWLGLGGTGESVKVCDLLRRKGLGTELVRVRGLLETLRETRRGESQLPLTAPATPPSPPADDDDGPRNASAEELRQIIRDRILGQIEELPDEASSDQPQAISDLAKVKRAIDALELAGGPADVTAFHDFYTLQIAFKNVWTAAFDDRLSAQAAELYQTVVQLHEEYGLAVPDIDAVSDVNAFRKFLAEVSGTLEYAEVMPIPPDVNQVFPQLTLSIWNRLDEDGQANLRTAAGNYLVPWSQGNDITEPPIEWSTQEYLDEQYRLALQYHMSSPLARAEKLAIELADRLGEPYAFHYFAPYTVNYGIVTCYRQEWIPETYQAGRLVATVPLAPGEKRIVKTKQRRKVDRIEKEIEKALAEQSSEGQLITRAESEIMQRTNTTTNFQLSAQGTLNFAIGSVTSTTQFGVNQVEESSKNLKRFDEATRKTAEKVRQEREMHAEVTDSFESESESTHELANANDELTVTYLLYELERRYRVTARLHRVTPVIMVALDMPAPHEITDAWIVEHAWIIRRVLLDDSFREGLALVEGGRAADEMQVEIRRANWQKQRDLVTKLEATLDEQTAVRDELRERLIQTTERQGRAEATELSRDEQTAANILDPLGLFHDTDAPITADLLKVELEAVQARLGHAEASVEGAQKELTRVQASLNEATDAYGLAMRERARKQAKIDQLRLHIRQNVFHYLHSIWSSKHPDELLFDLYHREVDVVTSASATCRLRPATDDEVAAGIPGIQQDGDLYLVECDPPTAPTPDMVSKRPLIELADLHTPLGFKGNYVLFPLKECTHITDYMMQEYIDEYFGVRDPARDTGYTTEELLRYAAELWNDPASGLSEAERLALRRLVLDHLSGPNLGQQTVIVPTGQVYMEALKGEGVLLEEFKRAHRGMDVLKVQEEVRSARLENLRRAARLADVTPNLEAAHADKLIMIQGGAPDVTITGDE